MQRSSTADLIRAGLAALLVVVLALGLLYAYRSQAPAIPVIPISQAVQDIQNDRVSAIVIQNGTHATLTLVDGSREATNTTGGPQDPLLDAVSAHNSAKPGRGIAIKYENGTFDGWPVASVLIGLLPVLFLAVLILFAASVFMRARRGDAYEQLTRIAGLRDRGVLTEDEFQREKRRLLR